MNLPSTPTPPLESVETPRETDTRFSASWLILARVAWTLIVILALMVAVAGFVAPQDFCGKVSCSVIDFSSSGSTAFGFMVFVLPAAVWVVGGCVLFLLKSDDWLIWLFSLMFVIIGVCNLTDNLIFNATNQEINGPLIWQFAPLFLYLLKSFLILLAFALFPNGRFVPRWTCWVPLIYPAYTLFYLVLPAMHLPGWTIFINPVNAILWFGCEGCLAMMQLYRYARRSGSVEQQQIKWVIFSIVTVMTADFILTAIPNLLSIPSLYIITNGISNYILLILPCSLLIAFLQYHLWDIDIIINRTLVYGSLSACIVSLYALIVGTLSTFLQAQGNFLISLLATGLVAVLFHPLRERLQQIVNRLFYGQRDEPYTVISQLGSRLEATLVPEQVLPTIVETISYVLKLPYAAIVLPSQDNQIIQTSVGTTKEDLLRLPLRYQSELVGELLLAPRASGENFSSRDQHLLEDLASQIGIAVYAARLTTDQQRLTTDLQHSRTQIVTVREEERRRLRRDLHDGLGSVLASLNFRTGAIRAQLERDPVTAEVLLEEQQSTIRSAIADIRRLVYELRPPSLDELGLVGALREQVAHYTTPSGAGLHVTIEEPKELPVLPAAVEVAAYRIVQEALANVARHSQASSCCLQLSIVEGTLQVEVTDNGVSLPSAIHVGVGLLSMRERAAELGGRCSIQQGPKGGTHVRASLPFLSG